MCGLKLDQQWAGVPRGSFWRTNTHWARSRSCTHSSFMQLLLLGDEAFPTGQHRHPGWARALQMLLYRCHAPAYLKNIIRELFRHSESYLAYTEARFILLYHNLQSSFSWKLHLSLQFENTLLCSQWVIKNSGIMSILAVCWEAFQLG